MNLIEEAFRTQARFDHWTTRLGIGALIAIRVAVVIVLLSIAVAIAFAGRHG